MRHDELSVGSRQEVLPLDVGAVKDFSGPIRPFLLAALRDDFADFDAKHREYLSLALSLASRIHLFVATATCPSLRSSSTSDGLVNRTDKLHEFLREINADQRVDIVKLNDEIDFQGYVENCKELALVFAEQTYLETFELWNKQRKLNGLSRCSFFFSPLPDSVAVTGEQGSLRPFRLVSAGGTFGNFHAGHRQYLELALSLADKVHLYIADDAYARSRKEYTPRSFSTRKRSVQRFLESIGEVSRVEITALRDVADIQRYVENCAELDLVLAERTYIDWFEQWNDQRKQNGLRACGLLCKARTEVSGVEIASAMLAGKRQRFKQLENRPSLF